MKKKLLLIISFFLFNISFAQKFTDSYIKDANKTGIEWWNQINKGEYNLSYNKLSDLLKGRFSKDSWSFQISMLMKEIGKIKSRSVYESFFQSELEGFEDGFYVIVNYNVDYTNTKDHTENIILKQDDNFEWKIFDFNYTFKNIE